MVGRFEWEDSREVILSLCTEDEDKGGTLAPSPGKYDDHLRHHHPLLPRFKKILEHFELPQNRLGWEILMDREFGAHIPPREISGPGELAEWEMTPSVWLKNRFGRGDWSDEFVGNPNPVSDLLHGWD